MRISKPVQIIPPGFLGFLQLKNNGVNPTELPDNLQPVIEMRDWMLQARARDWPPGFSQRALAPGTYGYLPFTNPISVPNNEQWYVWQYTARAVLTATDGLALRVAYRSIVTGTTPVHVLGSVSSASGAGAVAAISAQPFWLPPGAELGLYVEGIVSAGTIAVAGEVRYTPLPL